MIYNGSEIIITLYLLTCSILSLEMLTCNFLFLSRTIPMYHSCIEKLLYIFIFSDRLFSLKSELYSMNKAITIKNKYYTNGR